MPTTLAAVALAALVAAALLDERAFSARALAVVLAAAAAPDLDALLWFVDPSLHNAALHNVWIPGAAALALRADRTRTWLRGRFGPHAVAVAWVAVAAYATAVALDLFNVESAAVLWPVHGRFFAVLGEVSYSTTDGIEFGLVRPSLDGGGPLLPGASYGTVEGSYYVPSVFAPSGDGGVFVAVNAGWELLLALAAGVVAGGRLRGRGSTRPDRSVRPAGED